MSTRNFKIIKQLLSILKLGVHAKYIFFVYLFNAQQVDFFWNEVDELASSETKRPFQ